MTSALACLMALVALMPAAPAPAPAPARAVVDGSPTWPTAGTPQVVRAFDPPAARWLAGHRGVDLLSSPGAEVRSPIGGTIEFAGTVVDRGVVVIRSGEVRISLEPVTASVAVGDRVGAGSPVGTLEASTTHCAPARCLHWGLRVADVYHDPLLLVQRYRAVLLPIP